MRPPTSISADCVDVKQFALAPTQGFDLGTKSDLRIGIIGKYSDSDTDANPVLGGTDVEINEGG